MKTHFIILLLIIGISPAQSKDSTFRSMQLSWGVGNIMRQDMTVSPFIHKDWSPVIVHLNYDRSKRLYQQINLGFSFYAPKPLGSFQFNSFYNGSEETVSHSFKMIDFDYSLGKQWYSSNPWTILAGGKSRNFIYASDYYFGESGPSPMLISFGIDAWGMFRYNIDKKQYIDAQVSIPVFSFTYRNPYLNEDENYHQMLYAHNGPKEMGTRIADSQLRSWGQVQRMDLKMRYGRAINNKWVVGVGYNHSFNVNHQPTNFTQFENVLLIQGKLNF